MQTQTPASESRPDLKVDHREFKKLDRWDGNLVADLEDGRACAALEHEVVKAFRGARTSGDVDTAELAPVVIADVYKRLDRRDKEDPDLVHVALFGGFEHDKPSIGLMMLFGVLFWILTIAELGVATLQWMVGGMGFAVVLMGALLVVGGVLAGKGLARVIHATWRPSPHLRPLLDRIRWKGTAAADTAQLIAGLGLIVGVGSIRLLGSGLQDGLVISVVTVGLAMAIAVIEAVLTEWRFRYSRLHELLFEASEIIADDRHFKNRKMAEEDLTRAAQDPSAIPASSWYAAFRHAVLEQQRRRVIPHPAGALPGSSGSAHRADSQRDERGRFRVLSGLTQEGSDLS